MKLVTFEKNGVAHSGVMLDDDNISFDTEQAFSVDDLVAGHAGSAEFFQRLAAGGGTIISLAQVQLLAPTASPPNNIFCVGLNYRDHVEEGGQITGNALTVSEAPTFFTKAKGTIAPPHGAIPYWTGVTSALDYEIELAVIIGKSGRNISRDDAMSHIFGYTVANDVTARDVQFRHGGQWFKGKSLDGSLPLGPCLVTCDEIPQPASLKLQLTVNGEKRQQAQVSDMIFDIPTIIAELTAGLTIHAGDIILTGTPSGVGAGMKPPIYLKDGDEVICSIEGIGSLRNTVAAVL